MRKPLGSSISTPWFHPLKTRSLEKFRTPPQALHKGKIAAKLEQGVFQTLDQSRFQIVNMSKFDGNGDGSGFCPMPS